MKKKINNESSTETKLVRVDNAMNFLLWSKVYFEWEMKNYPDEESKVKLLGKTYIVQQDNISTIQLERHGKKSSTKRTQHIHIRYFYCTSLLENQTITAITY